MSADPGCVVIANPSVPVSHLDRNLARRLFTLSLTEWRDGTAVTVFVLADDAETHVEFTRKILALYPRQLRRVWDRRLYTGTG